MSGEDSPVSPSLTHTSHWPCPQIHSAGTEGWASSALLHPPGPNCEMMPHTAYFLTHLWSRGRWENVFSFSLNLPPIPWRKTGRFNGHLCSFNCFFFLLLNQLPVRWCDFFIFIFFFNFIWKSYNKIHITVSNWKKRCYGEGRLGDSFTITCWCEDARSPDLPCGAVDLSVVKSVALKNMLTRSSCSGTSKWRRDEIVEVVEAAC